MRLPRRTLARILPVVLLAAAGCGDGSTGPARTVTGTWSGTFSLGGPTGVLALVLDQERSVVSGTGTIGGSGQTLPLSADGTFVRPTLSVTLTAEGFTPMNLTGRLDDDTITGTLNGSGFVDVAVTLERQ
jgi:hypothetical protein